MRRKRVEWSGEGEGVVWMERVEWSGVRREKVE